MLAFFASRNNDCPDVPFAYPGPPDAHNLLAFTLFLPTLGYIPDDAIAVTSKVEQSCLKKKVEVISNDIAQWVRETREIGLYTSPENKQEIDMLAHSLDLGLRLWVNEEGTIFIPHEGAN